LKHGHFGLSESVSAFATEWMPPIWGESDLVLYGVDNSLMLFTLDVTNGLATPVGLLGNPCGVLGSTDIEWDAITGTAWSQAPNGTFVGNEFDITSGAATGPCVGNAGSHTGIETVGGVWYATVIFEPRGASHLHTFDPASGISTPIGPTGAGPISGLAYDTGSATMYGIAGGPGPAILYTINLGSGLATPVGPTSMQAGSLQFGPDGALYAGGTSANAGELHIVDPSSGASALVGLTGLGSPVTGLTLVGGSSDLKVDADTRQSPGKGHKTPAFAPTSCGALYLNNGAVAYLKDDGCINARVSCQEIKDISCSDPDMDGSEDCGTMLGDGKSNNSSFVNDWLLDGMQGEQGEFVCQDF
jgi:hypothetical protein